MLERREDCELDREIKRYSVMWTDSDMIYAKIYIETSYEYISSIHIYDPKFIVYLGQQCIHPPQLTYEFKHWRRIAERVASICGVQFIVEEVEDQEEKKSEKKEGGSNETPSSE